MSAIGGAGEEFGRNKQWSSYLYEGARSVSSRATTTFTPINQDAGRFLNPIESPPRTQLSMDGSNIWNIPEDEVQKERKTKGNRRAPSKATTARCRSLGKHSGLADDAIDHQNGHMEGESLPKRRKVAATGRSISAKPAANKVTPLVEDRAADDEPADQALKASSQAPKSSKSSTVRKPPKEKKMGPFKNPVITKRVSSGPIKELTEDLNPPSMPATSQASTFHGFQTSEQKLNNGLTQTTMDKLAAFRFRPAPVPGIPTVRQTSLLFESAPIPMSQVTGDAGFGHSEDCEFIQSLPVNDHNPDCAPLPASWDPESNLEVSHGEFPPSSQEHNKSFDQSPFVPNDFVEASDIQMDAGGQHDPQYHDSTATGVPQVFAPQNLSGKELFRELISDDVSSDVQLSAHISPSCPDTEFGELTSSELQDMSRLAVDCHAEEMTQVQISDEPELPDVGRITATSAIETVDADHEPSSESQIEMEAFEEIELPEESPSDLQWLENNRQQSSTDVQMDRSDLDSSHDVQAGVSKQSYDDEFDEGLDDSDFLALASDSFVPQTLCTSPADSQNEHHNRLRIENCTADSATDNRVKPVVGMGVGPLSAQTSDADDDYPMDEDDEAEMCKLDDLPHEVTDRNVPPQSVQDEFEEAETSEYDSRLQFSPLKSILPSSSPLKHAGTSITDRPNDVTPLGSAHDLEGEDWTFIRSKTNSYISPKTPLGVKQMASTALAATQPLIDLTVEFESPLQPSIHQASPNKPPTSLVQRVLDDSHEYQPLQPFARPDFPSLVTDRSPIVGLSPTSFLRVCFRIGEMLRQGALFSHADAIFELYARVKFSSREAGTTKQHFQFADIWHDRPPFPNGVLLNFKMSGLVESESRVLICACGAGEHGALARVLGGLKRDGKGGWMVNVINIRPTDWEEIRWTKRIVGAPLTVDGV